MGLEPRSHSRGLLDQPSPGPTSADAVAFSPLTAVGGAGWRTQRAPSPSAPHLMNARLYSATQGVLSEYFVLSVAAPLSVPRHSAHPVTATVTVLVLQSSWAPRVSRMEK